MAFDPSLELGIDLIDKEHRELVERVEEFIKKSETQDVSGIFIPTLNFLEDYTKKHFADEEMYQRECNYPKYALHKSMHENLIKDIADLNDRIDSEGVSQEIISSTGQFLLDWVIHHIIDADLEFGEYYKKVNTYDADKAMV